MSVKGTYGAEVISSAPTRSRKEGAMGKVGRYIDEVTETETRGGEGSADSAAARRPILARSRSDQRTHIDWILGSADRRKEWRMNFAGARRVSRSGRLRRGPSTKSVRLWWEIERCRRWGSREMKSRISASATASEFRQDTGSQSDKVREVTWVAAEAMRGSTALQGIAPSAWHPNVKDIMGQVRRTANVHDKPGGRTRIAE
jgi:hypothetical protein